MSGPKSSSQSILGGSRICADVPTSQLEKARAFYEGVLGLRVLKADEQRGVYYLGGGGTMLNLYERPGTTTEATAATFLVEDIERTMQQLRGQGVEFEEYDMPDLKTKNGVFTDDSGFKVCWFRDPDGNILSLEQLAKD